MGWLEFHPREPWDVQEPCSPPHHLQPECVPDFPNRGDAVFAVTTPPPRTYRIDSQNNTPKYKQLILLSQVHKWRSSAQWCEMVSGPSPRLQAGLWLKTVPCHQSVWTQHSSSSASSKWLLRGPDLSLPPHPLQHLSVGSMSPSDGFLALSPKRTKVSLSKMTPEQKRGETSQLRIWERQWGRMLREVGNDHQTHLPGCLGLSKEQILGLSQPGFCDWLVGSSHSFHFLFQVFSVTCNITGSWPYSHSWTWIICQYFKSLPNNST